MNVKVGERRAKAPSSCSPRLRLSVSLNKRARQSLIAIQRSSMPNFIRALAVLLCTIFLTLHIVIPSTALDLKIQTANRTHLASTLLLPQDQPPLNGYPFKYTSFAGTTFNLTAYDGF